MSELFRSSFDSSWFHTFVHEVRCSRCGEELTLRDKVVEKPLFQHKNVQDCWDYMRAEIGRLKMEIENASKKVTKRRWYQL